MQASSLKLLYHELSVMAEYTFVPYVVVYLCSVIAHRATLVFFIQ